MLNLFMRSIIVLAMLFGLLFAVGMAVLTYYELPTLWAVFFALGVLFLQYLLGPWILEWIYKIRWVPVEQIDEELAGFVEQVCREKKLPKPKFGIIEDGNPNAMAFGHYPRDARLVVTRGLLDRLDPAERRAVVGHELGHIIHWDFVVMTLAAAIPLLLFVVYRATLTGRNRRGRNGGYAALIGLISYFAYLISHYIVLLLSRVREYYADQFSAQVTNDPNSLASALVKVAYGLAATKQAGADDTRAVAGKAFGIFDPRVAQGLALASAGTGSVSADSMANAMKWDLWNPWAFFFELASTHPLPAKRIKALEKLSEALNVPPRFTFREEQPESYWDEFAVDLFIDWLPRLGFLAGALITALGVIFMENKVSPVGIGILVFGVSWWANRAFRYPGKTTEARQVRNLVSEVKVSGVRCVPGELKGTIIGRGVPGLFYSEDLVLQDETGFIVLDYRQPLRILELLFGLFKADESIGQRGTAQGWYRRAPSPRFELRLLTLENGKQIKTWVYPLAQFFLYATLVVGFLVIILGFIL